MAQADDDDDRLTNVRENELGTEPDNPDTDGDGLTDGMEVLSWGTDPLKRDTDGDSCTDGEEVNTLGTNPLEPDTDGDGVNDCLDEVPAVAPTPTPTPFPTVPGTNGDICPGSPSPSVIEVGIQAFVTAGGLPNRLRDAPSKETGEILGFIPQTEGFIVLDGPVCDETDFIRWWYVDYNGLQGWTAEGEGDEYYLEPPEGLPEGATAGGAGDDGASEVGRSVNDGGSETFINAADVVANLPEPGSVVLDREQMGLQFFTNIPPGSWTRAMDSAEPLDMGWVKVQANWRFLQPDQPNQTPAQLEGFYRYIRDADERGYKVMVSVAKAPDWARESRVEAGPPDDPEALADFIEQMLAAVGGQIDAIEVWNEPNLDREWTGTYDMTGAEYMRLFEPSYQRIRDYSPDIVVISAGLAPTLTSDGTLDDRTFLRQMYEAGLANYQNVAIGVHPYGWGNPPDVICCDEASRGWDNNPKFYFLDTLIAYRNIMLRYGDRDAQMWVTEFGWTTWNDLAAAPPEAWMSFISPSQQGDYIHRAFEIGQSLDYVGPMMLWNFNFANPDTIEQGIEIVGFSLVVDDTNGIRTRPVYDRFLNRRFGD
jgi:hypothetical protein